VRIRRAACQLHRPARLRRENLHAQPVMFRGQGLGLLSRRLGDLELAQPARDVHLDRKTSHFVQHARRVARLQ
jgi:hypothetical protein